VDSVVTERRTESKHHSISRHSSLRSLGGYKNTHIFHQR